MNVFVTGGTGYIGRHLISLLLENGDTVHALCRSPFRITLRGPGRLVAHAGDLTDISSLREGMRRCTQVYHLAGYARNWARNPDTYSLINVGGTRNILRAAKDSGVQRVVLTSSVLTIGFSNGRPATEADANGMPLPTLYAESKRSAEREALAFVRNGFEVVIVNPTRVYGPGIMSEGNSVTRMIKLHLAGRWPLILGDGSMIGNYAHVRDVARGHLLAMRRGRSGERYILGGENVSFAELFRMIQHAGHVIRRLVHVPGSVVLSFSAMDELRARYISGYPTLTPGWVRTFLQNGAYSNAKAKREIGYTITPLSRGLRETVDWLRNGEEEL